MRFVKLTVKGFQAIESAEIELGRGLNVLYGPNDLGKSTLATALRAALLVMPGTAETARYRPWFVDAAPEVSLTFVDDDDRHWRIKKSFGATSAQAKAELGTSKDGVSFVHDCDGRAVDEQLRKLLGWGIPAPGGKGAPRGLPTSFLANVLLGAQSDVEAILGQSTEDDATGSGKERLRKALAGLAEDPWFKRVLVEAQKKVDAYFTPTGQKKRGKGSPFAAAADHVKQRGEKLEDLRKSAAESRAIEETVGALRTALVEAKEAQRRAVEELTSARERHARAAVRARSEEAVRRAGGELAAIDQKHADAVAAEKEQDTLEEAVRSAEARVAAATEHLEGAADVVRVAEEARRSAASEDGARQREVTRAKLEKERAELGTRRVEAEKRRATLDTAEAAEAAAKIAGEAKERAAKELAAALVAEENARAALAEAEVDLTLSRAIVAYGEWHAAQGAAADANLAETRAAAAREAATAHDAAALALESRANDAEERANALRARLPDPALTKRIEDLHQRVEKAEAALGGGFSIVLKGTGRAALHVTTDGEAVVAGTALDGKLVLEADKGATVKVDDLLELEVVAGAADKRHDLERLRERWANEALPFLERAGVLVPAALRDRKAELDALDATLAKLRGDARQLRTEAKAARDRAEADEGRVVLLASSAAEVAARKAKLGAHDEALLARSLEALGSKWREPAEALVVAKDKAKGAAREALEKATRALEMAQYRASESEAHEKTARAAASSATAALGPQKKGAGSLIARARDELAAEAATIEARVGAIAEELAALEREGSAKVAAAEKALARANEAAQLSTAARAAAVKAHEEARSNAERARGKAEALRRARDAEDRAGAEARLAAAREAFAAHAAEPSVTEEDVALAEARAAEATARLEERRAEASHAEGVLSKVGGAGVREELRREHEAYELARARQHELELDADAWRLLRETLEEVEREGSTHLGRSLAAPISARLADLTGARYAGLRLDQHLKAETVEVAAAKPDDDVLDALSVGTRDQVATLLRLTVAEQLKSAIVLDDHLVHTDLDRLEWFREALRSVALTTQVVVITCRPHDYLRPSELPEGATRDLAGGVVRVLDVSRLIRRYGPPAVPGR